MKIQCMNATNVAVNGLATMEEAVLMATLLVSYAISTTIVIAMTPVNLATCAISTHAQGQMTREMNVVTPTYGRSEYFLKFLL